MLVLPAFQFRRRQRLRTDELVRRKEFIAAGAALSSQAGAALDFAGLLVELANPHLFLDPASLDELSEAANGLLGRFFVTQCQLNHMHSCVIRRLHNRSHATTPPYSKIGRSSVWEPAIVASGRDCCLQCKALST
jgi:hypothetical protein